MSDVPVTLPVSGSPSRARSRRSRELQPLQSANGPAPPRSRPQLQCGDKSGNLASQLRVLYQKQLLKYEQFCGSKDEGADFLEALTEGWLKEQEMGQEIKKEMETLQTCTAASRRVHTKT